jgi:hypothetical protein
MQWVFFYEERTHISKHHANWFQGPVKKLVAFFDLATNGDPRVFLARPKIRSENPSPLLFHT